MRGCPRGRCAIEWAAFAQCYRVLLGAGGGVDLPRAHRAGRMRGLYSYREGRPSHSGGPQAISQPFFQVQHAAEGVEGAIGKPPPLHRKGILFTSFHAAVQSTKQGHQSHPNGPQAISQPFFQVQHAAEGVEGAIGKPPPLHHKDKATMFLQNSVPWHTTE